jgi:hypothetical protein
LLQVIQDCLDLAPLIGGAAKVRAMHRHSLLRLIERVLHFKARSALLCQLCGCAGMLSAYLVNDARKGQDQDASGYCNADPVHATPTMHFLYS